MALDIKKAALNMGEDLAKNVIKNIVRPYAEEYILASPNKIDDLLLPFLDNLEAALMAAMDKIDGDVG
jgi:hypothetical protein